MSSFQRIQLAYQKNLTMCSKKIHYFDFNSKSCKRLIPTSNYCVCSNTRLLAQFQSQQFNCKLPYLTIQISSFTPMVLT